MNFQPEERSVVAGVEKSIAWLDGLAWSALVFTLTAAVANLTRQSEVALLGISFPVWGSYVGLIAFTIAHLFVTRHIIHSCADAWIHLSANQRNALFDHIVRTGGIMTKGASTYRGAITESRYSLDLKTNIDDPRTWIHHVLVLLALLALVDIEWSLLALSQLCLALVVLMTNWKIGENWLLCLGDLGSPQEKSLYFLDGTARPRAISHTSGLIIGNNIGFRDFFLGSIMESILNAFLLWMILLLPFGFISFVIWLIRA